MARNKRYFVEKDEYTYEHILSDKDTDKIDRMTISSGSTGVEIEFTDKEIIDEIINEYKKVKYNKATEDLKVNFSMVGWDYIIKFYSGETAILSYANGSIGFEGNSYIAIDSEGANIMMEPARKHYDNAYKELDIN